MMPAGRISAEPTSARLCARFTMAFLSGGRPVGFSRFRGLFGRWRIRPACIAAVALAVVLIGASGRSAAQETSSQASSVPWQQAQPSAAAPAVVAPDPFGGAGPTRLNGQISGQVALNAGDFQAITLTGRPEVYFVSGNGRYVVRGAIYDLWQGRELATLAEVKTATQTVNFPALVRLIPEFEPFRVGTGTKRVVVFLDPFCPYCQRLLAEIGQRTGDKEHEFIILPVALLGPESVRAVRNLHCASDRPAALNALLTHNLAAPLEEVADCDVGAVQKRLIFARLMQVRAVPFLIRDDGLRQEGMPANLTAWLAGGA